MPKAHYKAGEENKNYPKCLTCTQNACNAGMINHDTRNALFERLECLFECGCKRFTFYPGEEDAYEKSIQKASRKES